MIDAAITSLEKNSLVLIIITEPLTLLITDMPLILYWGDVVITYFSEESIKSFHSNYQCSMRDMLTVESFKIIRGYN